MSERAHRFVLRAATLAAGDDSSELWLGFIAYERPWALEVLGDLISADGMTDDELACVGSWVDLR